MSKNTLLENFNYVEKNKSKFLKTYENKYILVYEKKLIGSYDTYEEAFKQGFERYGKDNEFLIEQIVKEEPLNFVMGADI